MLTLLGGITLLVIGYFTYGKFIEKNFQIVPDRKTPAEALTDGMDFVPMSRSKNAIIQLLNIAGTGPIFGPIMGALYGPVAYIWIVVGCIFGGAVHDYMIGMISLRNDGAHLPELASRYLGKNFKHIVNLFSIVLLLLVGTVFVTTPANLISSLTPDFLTIGIITLLIFAYYVISTLLPIDKAMGKVYPYFGAILIISTIAIGLTLIFGNYQMPELTLSAIRLENYNGVPMFPAIFFTISCGALSGFHATQAPMVSRTTTSESQGRYIFYGMMIAEGVIAMIWAAASMSLFDAGTLNALINSGTPSAVVNEVSVMLLGNVFGTLAILGVIVLPISSGLSAFRSLRGIIADYINVKQDSVKKVLMLTIPIFAVSFLLTLVDFNLLWRYFNWANQVTAVIALFVATRYLRLKKRNYIVALVPGAFMLYAVLVYIFSEPIGFNLGLTPVTYIASLVISIIILWYLTQAGTKQISTLDERSELVNDHLPIGTFSTSKTNI
ncbi:carbon starvation protein A [Aerococcaceae bacterium DSM 111021]|nr:carbon starvation protein A [Aerococcaceae bacterium DSM 111021]